MRYEGTVYRPPSEGDSLILQLTIGCARNTCTFCYMYKDKRFRVRKTEEVIEDIVDAKRVYGGAVRRVFLADGDALIVKNHVLLEVMDAVHKHLPWVERITMYGTPKDVLGKTDEELRQLRVHGLEMVYTGAESGSDKVLTFVDKRVTSAEIIEAGLKLKQAGIKTSVTLISGLGGQDLWQEHAAESARVISAMKPEFVGLLALLIDPETKLYQQQLSGAFRPLDGPRQVMAETLLFLEHMDSEGTVFRANHASNYLPLGGVFNRDIPMMTAQIKRALETGAFRDDFFRRL